MVKDIVLCSLVRNDDLTVCMCKEFREMGEENLSLSASMLRLKNNYDNT